MEVNYLDESIELNNPYLVEGFPGIGLVAKIAADHIVRQLDMDLYAEIYSDQTSSVTVFDGDGALRSAIRIYASEEENLLVLKSDAPVSSDASSLMQELNEWMQKNGIRPLYQLGVPVNQKPQNPEVKGVYTGSAEKTVRNAGLKEPDGFGIVAGPTGGLLERALEMEIDAVGLMVESDPQFPDPLAAKKLIDQGVKPITGVDIDTQQLKDSAEEIRERKKQLAQQIQEAEDHEKSQAHPSEMYV